MGITNARRALKCTFVAVVATVVIVYLRGDVWSARKAGPDFSQYRYLEIVDDKRLDLDNPSRRAIFIGDMHGMSEPLDSLLSELHYSPDTDVLIHAGDVLTRGPHNGSMSVLKFLTSHNVSGVRGNHDQKVIEWRGWIEWVLSHRGGRSWLEKTERMYEEETADVQRVWYGSMKKPWKEIPEDWEFMGDHYRIAREMSEEEYAYLLQLPLVLHLPSIHTFVVHGGILPHDPRHPTKSSRQPLAHVPEKVEIDWPKPTVKPQSEMNSQSPLALEEQWEERSVGDGLKRKMKLRELRKAQELSVLADVPQNTDPWVLLNMRGVLDNNEVTRDSDVGTPWAELWNSDMKKCGGYNSHALAAPVQVTGDSQSAQDVDVAKAKHLPCYPSTVLYGHSAGRDLDLQRWTKGIDTGCVYNRRLTALVLRSRNSKDTRSEETEMPSTKFGDDRDYVASLVSVSC